MAVSNHSPEASRVRKIHVQVDLLELGYDVDERKRLVDVQVKPREARPEADWTIITVSGAGCHLSTRAERDDQRDIAPEWFDDVVELARERVRGLE